MDYDPTTENETPWEDKGIDHDDDDEEEVDTTRPFQPDAASTPYQPPGAASGAASGPYHGGEKHEMTHFGPGQSRLDDTIPLLPQNDRERAWNTTTKLFPDASATDIETYYDPRSQDLKISLIKMAGAGKKGGKVN